MTRRSRLRPTLALSLLLQACAGLPIDTESAHEVEIIAAGISYLRPRISERSARPDAVIVFDPTLVQGRYGVGSADPERARRVARRAKVQVRTLAGVLRCPANGPCELGADVVFRFGRPVFAGDSATVNVSFRWAGNRGWRDPTPVGAVELTLVRAGRGWSMIGERMLMISATSSAVPAA